VTRAAPTALRKMRWRESSNPDKRPPASGEGKETPACRWVSLNVPDTRSHRAPMAFASRRTVTTLNPIEALRRAALDWSRAGNPKSAPAALEITHGGSSALPGQPRQRIKRDHGSGNALSGIGRGTESIMRIQAVAATTIAPINAIACLQPSVGIPMCARPSAA
jgi:hypothetical protein